LGPERVSPPPRWLWYGCWTTILLALLSLLAIFLFYTRVLTPGQRESAKNRIPFLAPLLENFDPPLPPPDLRLPTPLPRDSDTSGEMLLTSPPLFLRTPSVTPSIIPPSPTTLPPTVTATLVPTALPTATPPTLTAQPGSELPDRVDILVMNHQRQTWNNCGPANTTMALSYFGWKEDQTIAAAVLKPGGQEDKNVSPSEIVDYIEKETGVRALYRVGGDIELLRALVAARFPVIIETGYSPEGYDWIGHYRTLAGYQHNTRQFLLYDSYLGSDESNGIISQSYEDLDEHWRHFNRVYIVVYEPAREERVYAILGERLSENRSAELALETALAELRTQPTLGIAWFNAGASLTLLGDYEEAVSYFDEARRHGIPWRMTWYRFTPYEAYHAVGRFADLNALLASSLNAGGEYVEETYYWRGRLRESEGNRNDARYNYRTALIRNPNFEAARRALESLDA